MKENDDKHNTIVTSEQREKKEINIAIGSRLLELRTENAISKRDMAKLLGLTVPQYHRYEGGTNTLPYEMLAKICEQYHFDLNYVVTGIKEEKISILAQVANMSWNEKCETFKHLMQYWGEFMRRANWSRLLERENE